MLIDPRLIIVDWSEVDQRVLKNLFWSVYSPPNDEAKISFLNHPLINHLLNVDWSEVDQKVLTFLFWSVYSPPNDEAKISLLNHPLIKGIKWLKIKWRKILKYKNVYICLPPHVSDLLILHWSILITFSFVFVLAWSAADLATLSKLCVESEVCSCYGKP